MRAVLNREAVVRVRIDDEGGILVAADANPTVTVFAGDGSILTVGTAAPGQVVGVYEYVLPLQTKVDSLQVKFSSLVGGLARSNIVPVDLIGARLVELWRLREDPELQALPTLVLQRVADAMEEWFRSALRFPPTLESRRATWHFSGGARLLVPGAPFPRELYSLTTDQVAYTTTEVAQVVAARGHFEWSTQSTQYDLLLGGEYAGLFRTGGLSSIWCSHAGPDDWGNMLPEDLVRAGSVLARYLARTSNYPERASQVATEGAVITFSVPSPDRPTGLPEVDAVINRYRLAAVV